MATPEKRNEAQPPDSDRRAFLAATAGAATLLAAGSASAQAEQPAARSKLAGSVAARFDPKRKPKLEEVHAALDRILDLHGCTKCGLLGIDIRLFLGDPPDRIPGFEGVDVNVQKPVGFG